MRNDLELFSLFGFDRGPAAASINIPSLLRTEAMNVNHEQVLCTNAKGVHDILMLNQGRSPSRMYVEVHGRERGYVEYFGNDIQLIGAACIHDAKHVLTLELTGNRCNATGYQAGSITYPQGHCEYDQSINKLMAEPDILGVSALLTRVRQDAFREATEELMVEAPSLNLEFSRLLKEKIVESVDPKVYPIYLDCPGSPRRHLCILFDVDVTGTAFDGALDMVSSNEPKKHTARSMAYEDFLTLDRIDLICPWVAESFTMIPFFKHSFVEDYIMKCARKAAF